MSDTTSDVDAGTAGDTDAGQPAGSLPSHSAQEPLALALAKLNDAMGGFEPAFTPGEADAAGAFVEDALDEDEARETDFATPRFLPAPFPRERT